MSCGMLVLKCCVFA